MPLCATVELGNVDMLRIMINELGADVNKIVAGSNKAAQDGCFPFYVATQMGHLAVLRYLVKEFGAHVNQADNKGWTSLHVAAKVGLVDVVKCLVKEFGADINQASHDGSTPLMVASAGKHTEVVVWLSKHGADAQAVDQRFGTAADVSRENGAPAEQTEYLKARAKCANPGCDGAGLKKCAGCLKVFFCGPACIRAH
jgi:ankyrin repeat protein